jgi:tetratricopeptide (TPR) repeat protein
MRWLAVGIACGCVLLAGLACAEPGDDDPDTEIAKRYFEQGRAAYDRGDYPLAINRFMAASRVKAAPAFEFNLARCYDRSDQPQQAIESYRRYLQLAPNGEGADESRARIAVLQARTTEMVRPSVVPMPVRRRYLGGFVGLGITLGLVVAVVGTGSYVVAQHASLKSSCGATGCSDAQQASMKHAALATDVLLGGTAAAAIATVTLFVVESRHHMDARARAAVTGTVTF